MVLDDRATGDGEFWDREYRESDAAGEPNSTAWEHRGSDFIEERGEGWNRESRMEREQKKRRPHEGNGGR